jgi:hypothetical protein
MDLRSAAIAQSRFVPTIVQSAVNSLYDHLFLRQHDRSGQPSTMPPLRSFIFGLRSHLPVAPSIFPGPGGPTLETLLFFSRAWQGKAYVPTPAKSGARFLPRPATAPPSTRCLVFSRKPKQAPDVCLHRQLHVVTVMPSPVMRRTMARQLVVECLGHRTGLGFSHEAHA